MESIWTIALQHGGLHHRYAFQSAGVTVKVFRYCRLLLLCLIAVLISVTAYAGVAYVEAMNPQLGLGLSQLVQRAYTELDRSPFLTGLATLILIVAIAGKSLGQTSDREDE